LWRAAPAFPVRAWRLRWRQPGRAAEQQPGPRAPRAVLARHADDEGHAAHRWPPVRPGADARRRGASRAARQSHGAERGAHHQHRALADQFDRDRARRARRIHGAPGHAELGRMMAGDIRMNRSIAMTTTLRSMLLAMLAIIAAPGVQAAAAGNTLQSVEVLPMGTQGVQLVLTTSGAA